MINTVQDYKVRGIPADTLARIRRAAAMRGMTQAEYLTALVELHAGLRSVVYGGQKTIDPLAVLQAHGLESVEE